MGAITIILVELWPPLCCGVCVFMVQGCQERLSWPLGSHPPIGLGGFREKPLKQRFAKGVQKKERRKSLTKRMK